RKQDTQEHDPQEHDPQEHDPHETAVLTIDLDALANNYVDLCSRTKPAECAAVVKADAYGLGMAEAVGVLWRCGCRTFFVATVHEGIELRALLPQAAIYVLNGLVSGTAATFHAQELRPVLNSAAEVHEWAAYCNYARKTLPCALHVDTGMNRLGLSEADLDEITGIATLWETIALALVMSHLACADDASHTKNAQQRTQFDVLRIRLPDALTSLANSAGILLGRDYHYDLVRPGVALYGGHPQRKGDNPFRPVVHLMGRILQIRNASEGETVGYGATRTLKRQTRIAVVSAGYADGLFRTLSAADGEEGLTAYIGPYAVQVLGRVSMDLISVDITGVPEELARRGAWVELLGPNVSAHALAAQAGTIDYEVLTSLGARATRRYIGG
ncbi:MAG: alanine racemase, partial [Pseudomonadota bacterium]